MNDVIKQNETAVQLTLGEDFLWSNQPVKLVIKLKADLEKKTLYSSSGEDDGHLKQVIEKWLPAEAEDNEHSDQSFAEGSLQSSLALGARTRQPHPSLGYRLLRR